jgi:hypothetical protein
LGRLLFQKDMELRLRRRLRLAQYLASARVQLAPPRAPVIIVGLPRTGSTMLHRLLTADPAARSPLYWELMHDSDDVSPSVCVQSDARAAAVDAGFAKLALFSPNGLLEFTKFHAVSGNHRGGDWLLAPLLL